jgi:hypothetical protein
MRAWTLPLAALLATATALAARPSADDGCSTGRFYSVRAPLFVLATAGADTVRAGPGPIQYGPQRPEAPPLESIHGQRFRLDRVGGDVPAELAGAEGREAIIVPYGWECSETWRWARARWADAGAQIFADVSLRPREQWVDGIPTFDVEMVHDIYPDGFRGMRDGDSAAVMTPGEVFGLMSVLPTWEEMEADTAAAYQDFLGWARSHPALVGRFPATYAMEEAQEWLQPCVPAYGLHPVAGTYRATVVVRETDTLTTWFRTDARGYPMCAPVPPRLDLTAVQPRMADTAGLYVYGSGVDEASIPVTNQEARNRAGSCSSVRASVLNQPRTDESGRRSWAADFENAGFTACFRDDPRVWGLGDSLYAAYTARTLDDPPGWFHETEGGGMRFERTWRVQGRPVLEVRATRIGLRTLN